MPRARIKDVAVVARVSTATVSHVINKTRYVSTATQNRVLAAIEELGYQPSASAQSLASNRSRIVGVVFSDITNPFFPSLFRGIEDTLSTVGYDLILANTGEKPKEQESVLSTLFSRSVDGLIIAPTGSPSEMLKKLVKDQTPIVLVDRKDGELDLPIVGVNNETISFDAIRHLIEDGHKNIGMIMGIEDVSTSVERLNGYIRALEHSGIEVDDAYIYKGYSRYDDGLIGAEKLLSNHREISAIFTTNNFMTLGALHAIRNLGLRCPDDIGVIGFDDHDWADIFTPPLTVVWQPTYELGQAAATLLEKMMRNGETTLESKILPARLIVRSSCSLKCHGQNVEASMNASRG